MLLARLFEALALVCANSGADMRTIAFVTEATPIDRILEHISEPTQFSGCRGATAGGRQATAECLLVAGCCLYCGTVLIERATASADHIDEELRRNDEYLRDVRAGIK